MIREVKLYGIVLKMMKRKLMKNTFVEKLKSKIATKIFEEIENALSDNFHADCQMGDCIEDYYDENLRDDVAELRKKYEIM